MRDPIKPTVRWYLAGIVPDGLIELYLDGEGDWRVRPDGCPEHEGAGPFTTFTEARTFARLEFSSTTLAALWARHNATTAQPA